MAKSCLQRKKNQNGDDNNETNKVVNTVSANTRQSKEIQLVSVSWEKQNREFEDKENEEVYKNFVVSVETDDKSVEEITEQQLTMHVPKKKKWSPLICVRVRKLLVLII